jgi:ACS family tartrate transporter-like MFS transporter
VGYCLGGLGFLACVFAPDAGWILVALSLNALGERIGAGSYWALTTNLMGARAAAGGIAFINSVGNLGGFFGPTLMGKLKSVTGGGYTAGLVTAAALMVLAALLALQLGRRSSPVTSRGKRS